FLVARRALYENVYFHKTVHCAEGMVSLFLQRLRQVIGSHPGLGRDGVIAPLVRMVAGETVGPEELLRLDDYPLTVLVDTAGRADGRDGEGSGPADRRTRPVQGRPRPVPAGPGFLDQPGRLRAALRGH